MGDVGKIAQGAAQAVEARHHDECVGFSQDREHLLQVSRLVPCP
jgi:hypothetical protein